MSWIRRLPALLVVAFAAAAWAQSSRPAASAPQSPPAAPPLPTGKALAEVDLMTNEGSALFNAQWRYSDAKIIETPFTGPGPDRNTPGPANTTYEIAPAAGAANFDDSAWPIIPARSLGERRSTGKVCFAWYRVTFTMPGAIANQDVTGTTAVLEATVDDYAEVWVNGQLPRALNKDNPNLITGWNTPNRVALTRDLKPGEKVQVAIFGINGPISAAPTNYIWFRSATIRFYPRQQAEASGAETAGTLTRIQRQSSPPPASLKLLAVSALMGAGVMFGRRRVRG